MAFYYLQGARRTYCKNPQRFGTDLAFFQQHPLPATFPTG